MLVPSLLVGFLSARVQQGFAESWLGVRNVGKPCLGRQREQSRGKPGPSQSSKAEP